MAVIGVVLAGAVDSEAADCAEESLRAAFGVETVRLEALPVPQYAWDATRKQYSSTLILRDALARCPEGVSKLLVLTEVDLFIPMLSFVFGQAQLDGKVAVLSFARLRQEFHSLPANAPLFMLRVRKETLHEMGHAFGLTHCSGPHCTMSLSTNMQQLDSKQESFCTDCALLIADSVGRQEAPMPSEA